MNQHRLKIHFLNRPEVTSFWIQVFHGWASIGSSMLALAARPTVNQ